MIRATNVTLTIGYGKKIWTRTIRNLTIVVHKFFFLHGYTKTSNQEPLNRRQMTIITIMGPIFNIILSVITYTIYVVALHVFAQSVNCMLLAFLFNVWLGIINLIPFKIGKKQSDGFMLLQLLRKKNATTM